MSPTYSPRARSRLAFGMLCTTLLVSGCAKTEPSPGPSARSAPATSVRPTVLGTTSTTPAPTEGSKPLPATTLASASVLKGSRVVATATGVSLEVPAGWEAYSFGVLNALADAPPARVVAAADFADESPTDYVRDRAADVEAIAVGPGRRPYSMTVAAVPLVDGKDADLAEVSKDKDAQIVTWRTGLGKAKVYAYDLGNAAVVTVEAHVRRGDHVIAITAVGPHLDTTVNLLRKALPSLRAL